MQRIYYLNSRSGKMKLQVRGIYVRGAMLFFSLKLINRSSLDYAIDSIRFFIAVKGKKEASAPAAERAVPCLYV